jgi:curved DNA-binding protein CbpA
MPPARTPDPYATLGVPRGARQSEIRAAYRRLAKRHHPDLHTDARATEQMRRVNQAWEVLSNPSLRAAYDADNAAGSRQHVAGHWTTPPRRSTAAAGGTGAAAPPWATYGSGSGYEAWTPRSHRYGGRPYAEPRSDGSPSPLLFAGLVLLLPVAVLSVAILSGGLLPFPLFGILVLIAAGRLFGRDG